MKDLLQHDFFVEDLGLKVETVNQDQDPGQDSSHMIQLRLRVVDPKKRKTQHKENEAVQFDYNMDKDNPEDVAIEMVRGWL